MKALFDIFLCYSFFGGDKYLSGAADFFNPSLMQRDVDKLCVIVFCKFCVCVCVCGCGFPSVLNKVTTPWFGD